MSATTHEHPMAFYHQDGLVSSWNFASRFAGNGGHIATLPEIVELRLGAEAGIEGSPWENWYTSSSAEYVGIGADGSLKIIVAHGVGPMATIDGIKRAYKWQWGDKDRRRRGGRITAQEFLDLEAGKYGETNIVDVTDDSFRGITPFKFAAVNVINFWDYLDITTEDTNDAFSRYYRTISAMVNPLLCMRLGPHAREYLLKHGGLALDFDREEDPVEDCNDSAFEVDKRLFSYITMVDDASNCPYVDIDGQRLATHGEYRCYWWRPRKPENGYAFAHLLNIDQLMITHTHEIGKALMSSPGVHEWSNGAKFIGVPQGAKLDSGLETAPYADDAIRRHWQRYAEPVEEGFTPIVPFRVDRFDDTWFAQYPKVMHDVACMDSGDAEFHVNSIEQVGEPGSFTVDETFFLRYQLSQVQRIAPKEANAYEIVDTSRPDSHGVTTVTVKFYRADVDTSRRLPRTEAVARDYDRLMMVASA